jgi:type I restriction enzyme S subunit
MTWPALPMADVLADTKSGFACGEDVPNGVFQFRMNNVTTEGIIDLSKQRRVSSTIRNLDHFLVEPGDVLFNMTNSPELVGKSAFFAGNHEPTVFSNHFLRLRPDSRRLDGRFLARWLSFQFRLRTFEHICRRWVNQATVSRESLLALPIPLPPLGEQRRIADLLDQTETLRAKRRQALVQLGSLAAAVFLDLFGDPASNPKAWPVRFVADLVVDIRNGLTRRRKEPAMGSDIVLRLRDIRSGWIDFSDVNRITLTKEEAGRYGASVGDLLFIRVNGNPNYVGRCAVFQGHYEPVYFNDHIMRIAVERSIITGSFLAYALSTSYGKDKVAMHRKTSAGQHTISQEGLGRIPIPVPPLGLQQKFSDRISDVRRVEDRYQVSLVRMDALFASLQERAFQ